MAENILKKLVNNSQMAIDDGVYDVDVNLQKSSQDFQQIIKSNSHATLLTEVKFSSPSLGKIRTIGDPSNIAKQMIEGCSKALSVLTQPHLFNGSPDYFSQVRKAVDVPMLMKDIMIDHVQINAAKKIGADYMLVIQSLFDQKFLTDIDDITYLNIKHWIDLALLGNMMMIINLVYLNMISDKASFRFLTQIPLDGNNCLFLFKILVLIADKYYDLLDACCLEYDMDELLNVNLLKSFNNNLDRFIVSIGGEEDTNRIIRQYIRDQITTLKEYNDHVTSATINILDRSSNVINSGLKAELLKNNSVLADELIKKFS